MAVRSADVLTWCWPEARIRSVAGAIRYSPTAPLILSVIRHQASGMVHQLLDLSATIPLPVLSVCLIQHVVSP